MKSLSIGEVARRTGIRTSALRYYEEVGILPTAARVEDRTLSPSDVQDDNDERVSAGCNRRC